MMVCVEVEGVGQGDLQFYLHMRFALRIRTVC